MEMKKSRPSPSGLDSANYASCARVQCLDMLIVISRQGNMGPEREKRKQERWRYSLNLNGTPDTIKLVHLIFMADPQCTYYLHFTYRYSDSKSNLITSLPSGDVGFRCRALWLHMVEEAVIICEHTQCERLDT